MFRFTIRDVLWLTVVVGALLGWWNEHQKSIALTRERDDATAQWHDASKKWLEAIQLPPPPWPSQGGMVGAAAAPMPLQPAAGQSR
jgi:hypothetical protein